MTNETLTPRQVAESAIEKLGLSIRAEFIPFSRSRNKDEKQKSLNWRVTLVRGNRDILTTDYSAGVGHCPAYKNPPHFLTGEVNISTRDRAIARECETGREYAGGPTILPDPVSVIHSLAMDSDVLDAGGFEDWASNYGYDTDSRKAESIYRACLEIALKLRAGIGDAELAQLREAFVDY